MPVPYRKYQSVEESLAAAKKQLLARRAKKNAERRESLARTRVAAQAFIQNVEPVVNSKIRTRLFIALCEYGPMNIEDVRLCVASMSVPARQTALGFFVRLGIVVYQKPSPTGHRIYALNPGHPNHDELRSFGLALARRWPSPERKPRRLTPVPVALPEPLPCNLFGREERNRALLLIAVTGGITPMQMFREGGMFSTWDRCDESLGHLQKRGLLAREPLAYGKGSGQGQPRRYLLDPEFFAYEELQMLLWAMVATLYDDIAGLATALAKDDPTMRPHVQAFKSATSHLREW